MRLSRRWLRFAIPVLGLAGWATEVRAWQLLPTEDRLCHATYVLVGRAAERESFTDLTLATWMPVWTRVTFRVERAIHGSPPDPFTIVIPGGRFRGKTLAVSDQPLVDEGRWSLLFLVDPRERVASDVWHTDLWVSNWDEHPLNDSLPPESELQALWAEHCAPTPGGPRPTERYLSFLRGFFLEICEHY